MTGAERVSHALPHLSHSRISRYLLCPEQYRLHYIEGLRPRKEPASLVFGRAIHESLEQLFRANENPVERFQELWDAARELDVSYSSKESWESLREIGTALLEGFVSRHFTRIGKVHAVEERFELAITALGVNLVGIIDLVAELDGSPTLIDFKTAGASYSSHEAVLSDQLTAYQLAQPWASRVAFCVLTKTKTPRITWHITGRSGRDLSALISKATLVERGIVQGEFHRRPGLWCRWCDFLPVCTGDHDKVAETLNRLGDSS